MSQASPDTEQIERELAALGEAPPSEAELALVREPELAEHEPEIASTARLVELTEPIEFDDLSELEAHRAWRRVEQRLAEHTEHTDGSASDERPDTSETSAPGEHPGGGSRRWLLAAVSVAAAAALVLVALDQRADQAELASGERPSAEGVAEVGEQARKALAALDDGKSDTARAAELAAEYERRLAGQAREEQGG